MSDFLIVNGKAVKTPSKCEPILRDISASESGRTQDGTMHKNRIGQKWTISLGWNHPSPEEVKEILTAFDPEYFEVTFVNPKLNAKETRTFYAGDRSTAVKQWFIGGERYAHVSFDIIER